MKLLVVSLALLATTFAIPVPQLPATSAVNETVAATTVGNAKSQDSVPTTTTTADVPKPSSEPTESPVASTTTDIVKVSRRTKAKATTTTTAATPTGPTTTADPNYQFAYHVRDPVTGDDKTASETRDGDVIKGFYTVADPDGFIRTVHYVADPKHGFQATVERKPIQNN